MLVSTLPGTRSSLLTDNPNPFRGKITLGVSDQNPAHMRPEVFDVLG